MSQVIFVDFKKRKVDRVEIRPPKPKGNMLTFPCAPSIFAGPTLVGADTVFGDTIVPHFKMSPDGKMVRTEEPLPKKE